MSLLARIAACHAWDPAAYRPLLIGGERLGRVRHDLARRLADFPKVFRVTGEAVAIDERLDDFESRGAAVAEVMHRLSEAGEAGRWRGEDYPVVRRWGETPRLRLDRGVVPDLGTRGFGVHVNGIVETGGGGFDLWLGKRAMTKASAPGKLDHVVAGGQPFGLSVRDNLIKECAEEAAIPAALAATARPVGAVAYCCERPEGLRDDVLFCFDLALPEDFTPVNTDGEVESFQRWPAARVLAALQDSDVFKFNVALVQTHLFLRRGLIAPDQPGYHEIVEGLWKSD